VKTLAELVQLGSRALEASGWDAAAGRRDAEVIARAILHWDMADWLSKRGQETSETFHIAFDAAMARRRRHEPVAYITGEREFYGRRFVVSPSVLIPRPETELVVDEGLAALVEQRSGGRTAPDIVDVGTGSGILAITLALESPSSQIVATDVSRAALALAAKNVTRFDLTDRVELRHSALLGGDVDGRFDLVVSNPPYVADRDRPGLMPDVRDHEPDVALFGGADGLEVIRALIPAARRALRPGGWLVMEMGAGQSAEVTTILEQSPGLVLVRISSDLAGIPRVLLARRPNSSNSSNSL
jgi:release factor glutamine methyltransferase